MPYGIKLEVWGDRACFTRPEMEVERASYDGMTPSPVLPPALSRRARAPG